MKKKTNNCLLILIFVLIILIILANTKLFNTIFDRKRPQKQRINDVNNYERLQPTSNEIKANRIDKIIDSINNRESFSL